MGRGLDGYLLLSRPSAVFKLHGGSLETFRWRDSERETPLPIPNRAVKPLSADGTWRATSWESRSPPVFTSRARSFGRARFRCADRSPSPVCASGPSVTVFAEPGMCFQGTFEKAVQAPFVEMGVDVPALRVSGVRDPVVGHPAG